MNAPVTIAPTPEQFLDMIVEQFAVVPPEAPFGAKRSAKERLAAQTFMAAFGADHPLSDMIRAYMQAVNVHLWRPDVDDLEDLGSEISGAHDRLQEEIEEFIDHAR